LFCRRLCERVICPNLRPQTGPEGGGDSKADSETYPVAEEIAATFIGEPNSGKERWACAFSAKGLIGTGRPYDRIICVTSKFARAKDRSALEDALSKEHNVPVIIHDRSWIVKEVIEHDRKDIAYNYLHVGEIKSDPLQLGPTDYSRFRQLRDIEGSFDDPEAYRGMECNGPQKRSSRLNFAEVSKDHAPRLTDFSSVQSGSLMLMGHSVIASRRDTNTFGQRSGGSMMCLS